MTTNPTVLIPLPAFDFDPTECAVPWLILHARGVRLSFATPTGEPADCDGRMLTGKGLGLFSGLLAAKNQARAAYEKMRQSEEFKKPISWSSVKSSDFDGILLPGGHAPGMRPYLESEILQALVVEFFDAAKPVGAICHGVVLAARSCKDGISVLRGRKVTSLLASQELFAWAITRLWLGNYYRTYPQTVEAEVRSCLGSPKDYVPGPMPLLRDSPAHLSRGFALRDRNFVTARWPGDAHAFASEFLKLLLKPAPEESPRSAIADSRSDARSE